MVFGVDDLIMGGSILTGLGSIFGSAANNERNIEMQRETNRMNAEQAQLNRDFQERMSNTAYQRGMSDMRAAGLNPILAYQKGGASSPSGAQAAMVAPKSDTDYVGQGLDRAISFARQRLEMANTYATNYNIQADTAQKDANSALAAANAKRAAAETELLGERLGPARLERIRSDIDSEMYGNSAMRKARQLGTAAEEGSRTVDPIVNNASKLLRGYNETRSRRSTTETSSSAGPSTFTERFHY